MAEYAYVHNGIVNQIVDIRPDLYASWVANNNPKAKSYLPIVNDPNPIYDPSIQVVEFSYAVEASRVRRVWSVRPKTADERRKVWTSYEFLQRFTPTERRQVWARAKSNDDVADFLMLAQAANDVISDDPNTIAGLSLLVSLNILTNARKEEILNG